MLQPLPLLPIMVYLILATDVELFSVAGVQALKLLAKQLDCPQLAVTTPLDFMVVVFAVVEVVEVLPVLGLVVR